jgi:hypothetical protein
MKERLYHRSANAIKGYRQKQDQSDPYSFLNCFTFSKISPVALLSRCWDLIGKITEKIFFGLLRVVFVF